MAKKYDGTGGRDNIDPDVGKATQFPNNDPTKGGRPKTRKLREVLEKIGEEDNKLKIPIGSCEITNTHVILTIPSIEQMASILQTKAKSDVAWFREWAKVTGSYAPKELEVDDKRKVTINFGDGDKDIGE